MSISNRLNIELVIVGSDPACVTYQRHFRSLPQVEIKNGTIPSLESLYADSSHHNLLFLPLSNGFGLMPHSGVVKDLCGWLGVDFMEELQQQIKLQLFGEQLPGQVLVLESGTVKTSGSLPEYAQTPSKTPESYNRGTILGSPSNSNALGPHTAHGSHSFNGRSYFKAVLVGCAFRVLTPSTDGMSWLDPLLIHEDWAYNLSRAVFMEAAKYASSLDINTPVRLIMPDLHSLRLSANDPKAGLASSIDLTTKQIAIAWDSIYNNTMTSRRITWADAILLQRLVLNKESSSGISSQALQVSQSSSIDEMEKRGLTNSEDLLLAIQWVKDVSNPERQLQAARIIASVISNENSSLLGISREDVAKTISNKDIGCLPTLLNFIQQGQIKMYVEIPPEELTFGDEIGTGTAGSVMRAVWRGKVVAVKKFRGVDLGDFLKELSIMSIIQHPSLVKCYGGCSRNKDNMYIVQELMDCNINDVLRSKSISMDLGIKLRIAIAVAKGISHLHTHSNLIHRDVKSLNLLTSIPNDKEFIVKVCDFGVSRVIDRRKTMTGNVGTVSWIAPEVFEQRKYSEKADVYSFGIVLWELYTRKVPFADIHSFSIPVAVIKGERPAIPKDCPTALKKLIRECWQAKATKRPTFARILEILLKILEQTPPSQKSQQSLNIAPVMLLKKKSSMIGYSRHKSSHFSQAALLAATSLDSPATTPDSSPTRRAGEAQNNVPHQPIQQLNYDDSSLRTPETKRTKKRTKIVTMVSENNLTMSSTEVLSPDLHPSTVSVTTFPVNALVTSSESAISMPDSTHKDNISEEEDETDISNSGEAKVGLDRAPTKLGNDDTSSTSSVLPTIENSSTTIEEISTTTATTTVTAGATATTSTGDESSSHNTGEFHTLTDSPIDSDSPGEIRFDEEDSSLSSSPSLPHIPRKGLAARASSTVIPQPLHTRTVTCQVPDKWAPPIAKLESQVNKYFSKLKQDLDQGTITVNNERYLLFRAKSLAFDFFQLFQNSFSFDNPQQNLEFAQNFIYDLGCAIGKRDSEHFLLSAGIDDPVARNNAGLVHVAYTGIGFVNLLADSIYSKSAEDECLLYEYTFSFESDSWLKTKATENKQDNNPGTSKPSARTDFCTCMLSAGYMSGWGEGATGTLRATAEVLCRSKGDHQCLFIRSVPHRLESMVKNVMQGQSDPLPRFLKNRSDTLPPSMARRPHEDAAEENQNWLQKSFKQLFKKAKKNEASSTGFKDTHTSPQPRQKFNSKLITAPELSIEEIEHRASDALSTFFIDPTTATVEMADERCVLLRGDSLAYEFLTLVEELFGTDEEFGDVINKGSNINLLMGNSGSSPNLFSNDIDDEVSSTNQQNESAHSLLGIPGSPAPTGSITPRNQVSTQIAWKFLFDLGKTIGAANQIWFAEKIGLSQNPIERLTALPVNLAYFGWCDLIVKSGLSYKEFSKSKENFVVHCEISNSFEATSWVKHRGSHNAGASNRAPCVCYMHSGYLSGWFESALKTSVVAVETTCRAQGAGKTCQFVIAHTNNIKKAIASTGSSTAGAYALETISTNVAHRLLAKFKQKRRESRSLSMAMLSQLSRETSIVHPQHTKVNSGDASIPSVTSTVMEAGPTKEKSSRPGTPSRSKKERESSGLPTTTTRTPDPTPKDNISTKTQSVPSPSPLSSSMTTSSSPKSARKEKRPKASSIPPSENTPVENPEEYFPSRKKKSTLKTPPNLEGVEAEADTVTPSADTYTPPVLTEDESPMHDTPKRKSRKEKNGPNENNEGSSSPVPPTKRGGSRTSITNEQTQQATPSPISKKKR